MQLDLLPQSSPRSIPQTPVRKSASGNADSTYDLLKSAWLDKFPDATPAEYAFACNRIARELGL